MSRWRKKSWLIGIIVGIIVIVAVIFMLIPKGLSGSYTRKDSGDFLGVKTATVETIIFKGDKYTKTTKVTTDDSGWTNDKPTTKVEHEKGTYDLDDKKVTLMVDGGDSEEGRLT